MDVDQNAMDNDEGVQDHFHEEEEMEIPEMNGSGDVAPEGDLADNETLAVGEGADPTEADTDAEDNSSVQAPSLDQDQNEVLLLEIQGVRVMLETVLSFMERVEKEIRRRDD